MNHSIRVVHTSCTSSYFYSVWRLKAFCYSRYKPIIHLIAVCNGRGHIFVTSLQALGEIPLDCADSKKV